MSKLEGLTQSVRDQNEIGTYKNGKRICVLTIHEDEYADEVRKALFNYDTLQSALLKAEAQNKVLRVQRDKAIDESWGNPVGAHNEIARLNAEVEGVK